MGRHRTREVAADRARSFTTLKGWPDEALVYLQEVFERKRQGAGPTWAELLADLKTRFNVDWNDSSLSRYYGFWEQRLRVEREAHDQAVALAEHFLMDSSGDSKALLSQLLEHQRLIALSNLGAADPTDVAYLALASDRLELAKKKLGLDQEKKKLGDEKLLLDKARLELEREKAAAIDRPGLFLEFWKTVVETIAQASPEGAEVINRHFDQVMAKIKAGAA
ncbi:MAG: hypothetical protein ABSD47_01165 [Candidatus Methylomirabilota bacterium]|jgi:hypothetical protein